MRLRPEVRRGSPAEAVVAAEVGGGALDAISIDDRDALDDVRSIKSGDRLTRLGCFVIVVAVAADGSCGIDEVATSAEEDDDDGGKTSSSLATGRIAVYELSMMMMMVDVLHGFTRGSVVEFLFSMRSPYRLTK